MDARANLLNNWAVPFNPDRPHPAFELLSPNIILVPIREPSLKRAKAPLIKPEVSTNSREQVVSPESKLIRQHKAQWEKVRFGCGTHGCGLC